MKITKLAAYVGPNVVTAEPVIHLRLEDVEPQTWPESSCNPAPTEALLRLLPGLADHPNSKNEPNDFIAGLGQTPGMPLGQVVADIAAELLRQTSGGLKPAGVKPNAGRSLQDIFFGYDDPEIGMLAGRAGLAIVQALLPITTASGRDDPAQSKAKSILADFSKRAKAMALDQTALALIGEAEKRDIPWFILDRPRRLVQLGQGRHLRRIRETVTDAAPAISTWMQSDKRLSGQLLAELHMPTPRQVRVGDAGAAARAASQIGFPVVVKPVDGKKGQGISLRLKDEDAVRKAYDFARRYSNNVLVESFVPGHDHRVLMVGGKMIAAAWRIPAAVTGDGRQTVAELVAEANKDPRRGRNFDRLMNLIELDDQSDALLANQGFTRNDVPAKGTVVYLRQTANISTGGTAVDMTERVHPENRWMLERAARVVGLDVAGIDFITPDIGRSYREVGGAICEVNASPGLRPHQVAKGPPRDVVSPIIDMLFPEKHNGRIPIAAITGTNGKTTTSRMLAHILRVSGKEIGVESIGLVTTDGVHINGDLVAQGDFAGGTGARVLLRDPSVDAAVLETSRGGIIKSGLAFEWCDVAAITNVTEDHLGYDGVESLEDMAEVKGCVSQAARNLSVLNADNPHCFRLAARKASEKVCLISSGSPGPALKEHLKNGGLVVNLEGSAGAQSIVLHRGQSSEAIIDVNQIPATLQGAAVHNVENAMFAVALARGLGISNTGIAGALVSFKSDSVHNPGRLNIFDEHPFTVLFDRAHNPDGVKALCQTVMKIPTTGRRICVLSGIGNRHTDHIDKAADMIAGLFDVFVCSHYRDSSDRENAIASRGFPSEEIPKRIAAALVARGVDAAHIVTVDDYRQATDTGLEIAEDGDLLVFFSAEPEWSWNRVVSYGR